MYGVNLKNMDVDALLELRGEVDRRLTERQRDLQRQLGLLGKGIRQVGRPVARAGRVSLLRGVKVPPKYRGPEGETWAGRGATPRWLTALLKQGHSIEDFAIAAKGGKAAKAGVRRKRRARKG
jgi:DNA-binding protein H-NS